MPADLKMRLHVALVEELVISGLERDAAEKSVTASLHKDIVGAVRDAIAAARVGASGKKVEPPDPSRGQW